MDELMVATTMSLAMCTREDAIESLKMNDFNIINAVDHMLIVPIQIGAPKQKTMDDTQTKFKEIRKVATSINDSVQRGFTSSDQSASSEQVDLPSLPEETVQQSNYSEKCHPSAPESEAQKQETACQKQSECSFGSQ
jgi:hypothetical protein